MPASVPAPRLLSLITNNATERCQPGHADGQGNLALGVLDTRTPGDRYFRTYLDDPSGRLLGFFTANDLDLYEEASGFLSVNHLGTAGKVDRLSLAGQIEREAQMSPTPYKVSAEDPTGGAVVITFANQSLLMHGVESFDAQPVARWHYFPTENLYYVTHGVDRVGNTLLVYRTQADDALYGQWFSPADARGARFVFSGAHDYGNNQLQLVPRVGSGFFLQALTAPRAGFTFAGAAWVGQIDTGAQAVQPPPAWLRSWDNRKMHPAREGSAYAFIDLPGGTADCTQNIAVVSASGKTCGSTAFPAGLNPGACTTASIDVAWDGTVIQQRPDAQEQHDPSGTQSCTWSYWTGLLK